jgi:hypothetical protein
VSDLVHAIEAADHETLEVELVGDAQVEGLVEGVVVGGERTGRGPTIDGLQDRGVHLEEAALIEERAQHGHDARARDGDAAGLGVREQVEVTLAVAGLHVLQTVPLLGQGAQTLGEHLHALGGHAELPLLRSPHAPLDPHEVADVELPHEGEVLLRELLLVGRDLERLPGLGEPEEQELPEGAAGDDPSDHAGSGALRLESLLRLLAVLLMDADEGDEVAHSGRIGIDPRLPQGLEALAPDLAFLVAHEAPPSPALARSVARMKRSRSPSSTPSALPISTPVRWSLTRWLGCRV